MMGFAKATVWTLAPTEDAASIAMVSYFSGKLLHQHIVDSVVSPDCCRMLSLLDVSVYFQCVAVATIDCFGWSCSEQVYVTQETEVILVPTSSRVLQPVSQDYFELIEIPEPLERCKMCITRRIIRQDGFPNYWIGAPGFYIFRGYTKCGRKTFLSRLANELKVLCITFRATHLYHQLVRHQGKWSFILERWKSLEPCIIIIEDFELLWEDNTETEEIVAFAEEIRKISTDEKRSIVIVASCNCSAWLPHAIVSLSGMVVNFPLASKSARRQIILQKINESFCWSEKEQLVEASQGLTVGELKDSLAALGDYSNQWRWLQITWQRKREWRMDDLMHLGIRILFPNQLRDEAPFSCHLYGLESIIKQLDIMLNDHHRPPHILSNMRGILFYGPPGTGKTSLAKNIAYSVRATFLSVDVSNLIDSYVGESERLLRMLFRQAKEMAPCVVFLDEVDSLFNTRQRSPDMPLMRWRSSFILEMDDFKQNEQVYIVAATNRPWDLDQSLQGRLSKHFYVGLPNVQARTQIFMHHFQHMWCNSNCSESIVPFARRVAEMTENFSGADIEGLVRNALLVSCRKSVQNTQPTISEEDILEALSSYRPSITWEQLCRYDSWKQATY